jgi:hypothetical protein
MLLYKLLHSLLNVLVQIGARGSVVVKALRSKPAGCGVGTRGDELISSTYLTFPAALGPGVHSAFNRNEYQKQKNNISGE